MKKGKIFDIRYFPMDTARFTMMISKPFMRVKKLGLDGKKYKDSIKGGRIYAANHVSFWDPFLIGAAFWFKRVFFLVAEVVMAKPVKGFWLKLAGCIKIERQKTDLEAIRKSVKVLKDGKALMLFPQGAIQKDANINSIKSGTILIAAQAGAPIVPMYSARRKHSFDSHKFIIGEPFYCKDYCSKKLPSMAEVEMLSGILLERMAECRRVYEEIEGEKGND